VANVGDSRVYLLRDGELTQVTHDHSWVAELIAVGKITPEEARRHPMRNVVTRSLGGRPQVEVETYLPFDLAEGDIVLLCSDGLWGMVTSEVIRDLLKTRASQAAAQALIRAANEAGGHDNITAIVCRVGGTSTFDDAEPTEQLDPLQLQDTQPMPRLGP
jgi:protein phosphatase